MKNIYILVYEGFACHGIGILTYLLSETKKANLHYVGFSLQKVKTKEGFYVVPDELLEDLDTLNCDAFIIPGGIQTALEEQSLKNTLHILNEKQCLIACLCAATIQLAKCKIIGKRKYTSTSDFSEYVKVKRGQKKKLLVVRDENLITARGKGYLEFAIEVMKYLEIESSERLKYLYARYKPFTLETQW